MIVKDQSVSDEAIEQQVECLNELLRITETDEQFCMAHELVDRNSITQKPRLILKAIRFATLKPFRFLINKN